MNVPIARCKACGDRLSFDASFCLLCGDLLCARHFVIRKGLSVCQACQGERLRLESASNISEADEARIVALVTRDLMATIGVGLETLAIEEAARIRLFASTLEEFESKVVEDVQQRLHDEHLDTTWPTCPSHSNHPLWYSDGWWCCSKGGVVARLGELATVKAAPSAPAPHGPAAT